MKRSLRLSLSKTPQPILLLRGIILVSLLAAPQLSSWLGCVGSPVLASGKAGPSLVSPAEHFGHIVGADRKLVRWDGLVEYLRRVADASPRVNLREIGPTTHGRPFILLEISSESNLANLELYKRLQRRLYFQDHRPGQDPDSVDTADERQELFERHKAVVLITCSIHATEVGAAQMSLELVHQLATSESPRILKILDNVIFLLVPSLNPDGQAMIVDWYNAHLGTPQEGGPLPWLYHPYVGHDNNRDMYMYTQKETEWIGQILYRDWFPSIWLDEHQMGATGPRIFVMPATDPINVNVHPLIYRLNGVYGQAQAAALEAAGKTGIIYDFTYTNFWEGAMAWTGWWHNQVGMLTEVASVRIATPTEQRMAKIGEAPPGPAPDFRQALRQIMARPDEPLPPPRDVTPRTTYPRPWLGGKWTLRDIVEYERIATLGLLESAADTRRQLLEQIYEVNRSTIAEFMKGQTPPSEPDEARGYPPLPAGVPPHRAETGRVFPGSSGASGTPYAVIVPTSQTDPPTALKMLQILERAGVGVERATAAFTAAGKTYPAGTHVIRLAQVFGRYAKDMLEAQTYPEVRAAPSLPPQPPYDVTAWSLGLMMGVESTFINEPFEASLELKAASGLAGQVSGRGNTYLIDAALNDAFPAANRLLGERARLRRSLVSFEASGTAGRLPAGSRIIEGVSRQRMDSLASELGLPMQAVARAPAVPMMEIDQPRIALFQPWGSNMDEGWTRWLLERYGFDYTTLHPQDLRAAGAGATPGSSRDASRFDLPAELRAEWPPHVGARAPREVERRPLAERFDVLVFTHQEGEEIVKGDDLPSIPPAYRGGIGEEGLAAVREFLQSGGRVVALGDATDLFTRRWPIPVRNVAFGLKAEELLIPGSIVRIQTDPTHPLAWGMPETSHGYFIRSPAFALTEGFRNQTVSVAVRYPNHDLRASGWTRGEEHIAGRAAAIQVDFPTVRGTGSGGRLILLGLRPQHRAQTHATFKLLFNALLVGR
jgi:hypothetical protein